MYSGVQKSRTNDKDNTVCDPPIYSDMLHWIVIDIGGRLSCPKKKYQKECTFNAYTHFEVLCIYVSRSHHNAPKHIHISHDNRLAGKPHTHRRKVNL